MGRASVAAAGFAYAGGAAADLGGVVYVARTPDRLGRILLACVEPVEPSPRGWEIASVALRVIQEQFSASTEPSDDALQLALAAANDAVLVENRQLTGGRWHHRHLVGVTAIAVAGRDIAIAQCLPSQAIVVQDGQSYGFPDVASWRGDYEATSESRDAHPLGFGDEVAPRFFQSEAAPGDLVVLCSTSVGRAIGRDDQAVIELFGGSLLTSDLEGSVDRLERHLADNQIADAFAVVIALAQLPNRARIPRLRRAPRPVTQAVPESFDDQIQPAMTAASAPGLAVRPALAPIIADIVQPSTRNWFAEVAELLSARRRPPTPSEVARKRALAAPGAMSVRRYQESMALPAEWRANLPRGPGVHVPARLLAVSLVLFLALGGTGFAVGFQRDRAARAEAALEAVDTALVAAQDNPGSATSLVAEADTALASARESGASGLSLVHREQELARVRDEVLGVARLEQVVRLGALPSTEAGGRIHLALSGQTLYVSAGDLYEFDADDGRLLDLLSQGDTVDGAAVGSLTQVSIDGGGVVASDGVATYLRDPAGRWQRSLLAIDEVGGLRPGAPLVTWGDASYSLSWTGDMVRFDQTANGPYASVWAAIDDSPDLETTLDLTIDGRIHVLLEDGRILTFSRGELVNTVDPFVVPALDKPSFLADAPFANNLYVVDRGGRVGQTSGRIIRVDQTGDARQYFVPAPTVDDPLGAAAATALASAEDLAVDELSGTVFWVTNGELWKAHIPL